MNISFSWSIKMVIIASYLICNLCGVTLSNQSGALPDNSTVKVFILAGQSNAVGYNNLKEYSGDTEKLQNELRKLHNVTFWPGSNAKSELGNKWVKLQIGASDIAEKGPFLNNCFGPEIGFGISLSKAFPREKIAIIKYAVGATSIARSADYNDYIPRLKGFDDKGSNWHPPGDGNGTGLLYENLMENIHAALASLKQEGRNYEISGFIWMQGENEAGLSKKMANDYGKLLTLFMEGVRNDLGVKELPFIIGEVNSYNWGFGDIVRKRQAEVCQKDPNSLLIKSTDLSRNGVGGPGHFDADGMLTLGNRFARRMLQLLTRNRTEDKSTAIALKTRVYEMTEQQKHTFQIKNGFFLLDGKPFNIHSGEMDFARIPKVYWRQRLKMLKAMGMNTVATYVFWNYHETAPGVWDFKTDSRDIAQFISIARQEGLFVILRPGPYVCGEWEFGGFPWWLQKNKKLVLRSNNKPFLDSCKIYIDKLMEHVKDLQITHGGPIIMVQVENEFGSYVSQRPDIPLSEDKDYLNVIKQDFINAGINVPLFTADGSGEFKGGAIEGVLPTANGEGNIDNLKKVINEYHRGEGPYMVSEFYTGSLNHWKEHFQRVATLKIVKQLELYLKAGVSFNFYMAHGGTLFGFTSGANYNTRRPIQPDITSYDYDAPISEAGWVTPKYKAIREEMAQFITDPLPDIPARIPPISIPLIKLNKAVDLFDIKEKMKPVVNDTPMTFEDLNQGYGYVLYSKKLTQPVKGVLSLVGLRDYAQVYANGHLLAVLSRFDSVFSCTVDIPSPATLDILVENMGRINYGAEIVHNLKGIISPVTINGENIVGNWEMYQFPFSHPPNLSRFRNRNLQNHPTIYAGEFKLTKTADTFLDMRSWGKGIVFINGHNLGRYWNVGPQQTLYLPGCWLIKGKNKILIFEQQNTQKHSDIAAIQAPVLDQLRK